MQYDQQFLQVWGYSLIEAGRMTIDSIAASVAVGGALSRTGIYTAKQAEARTSNPATVSSNFLQNLRDKNNLSNKTSIQPTRVYVNSLGEITIIEGKSANYPLSGADEQLVEFL